MEPMPTIAYVIANFSVRVFNTILLNRRNPRSKQLYRRNTFTRLVSRLQIIDLIPVNSASHKRRKILPFDEIQRYFDAIRR